MILGGKDYKLTFSLGVLVQIEQKCGDIGDLEKWLKKDKEKIKNILWILTIAINATIQKNNILSGANDPLMTEEQIGLLCEMTSYLGLVEEIRAAFYGDSTSKIKPPELPGGDDPNGKQTGSQPEKSSSGLNTSPLPSLGAA